MNKSLLIFIFLGILSCNDPDKKATEVVNKTIDEASEELRVENLELKQSLTLVHQNLIQSSSDKSLKSKANLLFEKVSKTDDFIDSIQSVFKTLNRDDVEGVKAVKNLLAEGRLGDSLRFFLNNTFQQAKDFSINQGQKEKIDSIKTNMFSPMGMGKSWQAELFGMTNPLGASLILFSLQKELYNVGEIALHQ